MAEDSNTLRAMLRRLGFQLLIRRPVNPYALRLLLLRAIYAGEERRHDDRVPIGAPVAYRSGFRRRAGAIAELSRRGGRLLTATPPAAGRAHHAPARGSRHRPLALAARARGAGQRRAGGRATSTRSRSPSRSASTRSDLDRLLQHYKSGPAQLEAEIEAELREVEASRGFPLAAPSSDAERRKHERVVFRREVIGLSEEAATVLMGRDLSIGGMRVEGSPRPRGRASACAWPCSARRARSRSSCAPR